MGEHVTALAALLRLRGRFIRLAWPETCGGDEMLGVRVRRDGTMYFWMKGGEESHEVTEEFAQLILKRIGELPPAGPPLPPLRG